MAPRRLQSLSAAVQAFSAPSSVVVSTSKVEAAIATLPDTSDAATASPLPATTVRGRALSARACRSCFSRTRRRRLLNEVKPFLGPCAKRRDVDDLPCLSPTPTVGGRFHSNPAPQS